MELAVADVEGDHVAGAALQQTVGESPGRRSGVERPPTAYIDVEHVECMIELGRAATDEPRGRSGDDHGVAGRRPDVPPSRRPTR